MMPQHFIQYLPVPNRTVLIGPVSFAVGWTSSTMSRSATRRARRKQQQNDRRLYPARQSQRALRPSPIRAALRKAKHHASPEPHFTQTPVDDAHDAAAVVQAWHRRLEANGPLHPAPTIAQAQSAGYGWLVAECTHCKRTAHVPFASIRRPPATPIADLLRALKCTCCGQKGPPAATIRGVALDADPIPSITIDI